MISENDKILKNSVLIIGPLGVGKSLLSKKIGQKLGLPVVCLDKAFSILSILCRHGGRLPTKLEWEDSQKRVYRRSMTKLNCDKYSEQISEKIASDYEILMSCRKLFDVESLTGVYFSSMKNYQLATREQDFQTHVFMSSFVDILMLKKIMDKLQEPVVLDASGVIGISLTLQHEIDNCDVHFDKGITTYDFQKPVLSKFGTKVYICPGQDFQDRNDDDNIEANKLIAKSKTAYMRYCDIVTSANGILYRDEPIMFQERDDYNIEKTLNFLNAKNLGEIENTTDQIVTAIEEFKQAKENKIK